MACADVCLTSDADRPDFWSARTVKAKKSHVCRECMEPIVPGEKYERSAASSGGHFYSHATCSACAEIRDAFTCGTYIYGELWQDICESLFPVWREKGSWDCLAKLTSAEALAMCNEQYAQWLHDNDYDAEGRS